MKMLVTGGAGFIGSYIVDYYLAAGHQVAIVDNLRMGGGGKQANIHGLAQFYQADITDQVELTRIFNEFRPDIVNHHAGQQSITASTKDPQFDVQINILGLLNVLTQASRVECRKIIFASSSAIYGTPIRLPLDEEAQQKPESPYGITRLMSEHYLRYWHESHGLNFTILRYANVYGPRQDTHGEGNVVTAMAQQFLRHEGVRIDWDGEQKKDYVYVEDVAKANIQAIKRGENEIFCIGTGRAVSVNEIYRLLEKLTGFSAPITRAPKRIGDTYQAYFNTGKAERLLNWKAETRFEEGVEKTLNSLR